MTYTTLETTEKAGLQHFPEEMIDEYCVFWFSTIGLRRCEKWFENESEAREYFDKIK